MKLYIRSAGNISPQKTFGHEPFLAEVVEHFGNRLPCIEPDYKTYIDPKLIRRMSRIIKMGVAAAMDCLQQACVSVPDAIITGTAYGCLEDTGIFLSRMVEQKEELLAPTAFIQSTHNTVGAQIALMLHCNGYNNVFVHRGFSFESALLDAILLLQENEAGNVLVGGVDETTEQSHAILSRLGLYRRSPGSNLKLYGEKLKGTMAGEGAAFFLITKDTVDNNLAELTAITTFYKPRDVKQIAAQIELFLATQSISLKDIDLLITGRNGDAKNDAVYDDLALTVFDNIETADYKHLCGEYPTSTAFALWMAANILHTKNVPPLLGYDGPGEKVNRVLIYNHSQDVHHSLILVTAC